MAPQALQKSRKGKIEPLNWKGNASAPALKGLVSFLDIRPEDLKHGFLPIDTSSTADTPSPPVITSPVVNMRPVATSTPIDIQTPVDKQSPIPKQSTPPKPSTGNQVSSGRNVHWSPPHVANMVQGDVPTRNRKISRCRIAQDGHTPAEEALYKVLWDESLSSNFRVRMGYAELAAKTRLSKKTISRIVQILIEKLAIEVLDGYRSGEMVPKHYRVFSYKEILERRRAAGMEYVIRTRGIQFVTAEGELILPEIEEATGPVDVSYPVDTQNPIDEMSIGDVQRVSESLNQFWSVDESAAVQLIGSCRTMRPDASADEIAFFIDEKLALIRTNRSITNPTGFVLATVPQCFVGKTFESFRIRFTESKRIEVEEAERKSREEQEMKAYFRRKAEAVLANPKSSDAERHEARNDLRVFAE